MKHYVYLRCSTDAQDFAQQQNCVYNYLAKIGVDPANIDQIVVEKISGTVNHTERKLATLIASCEPADTIYISELSRLGRNMTDLYNIINECCTNEVEVIQCKDGTRIENNSIGGKALLFALSLAAEIEVANIRQRTKMGLDARRKQLEKDGYFISNRGEVVTKFGNPTGDITAMIEGASRARTEARLEWFEKSVGFQWVKKQIHRGKTRAEIIEAFNELHEIDPENYSTRDGKPMSKGVLSKWVRMINRDLVVS